MDDQVVHPVTDENPGGPPSATCPSTSGSQGAAGVDATPLLAIKQITSAEANEWLGVSRPRLWPKLTFSPAGTIHSATPVLTKSEAEPTEWPAKAFCERLSKAVDEAFQACSGQHISDQEGLMEPVRAGAISPREAMERMAPVACDQKTVVTGWRHYVVRYQWVSPDGVVVPMGGEELPQQAMSKMVEQHGVPLDARIAEAKSAPHEPRPYEGPVGAEGRIAWIQWKQAERKAMLNFPNWNAWRVYPSPFNPKPTVYRCGLERVTR